MRYVLTSFLALHWAIVFALLAFVCVDGKRGAAAALGLLGAGVHDAGLANLDNAAIAAPLAVAFLILAVLFCWAFVEVFANDANNPYATDNVIKIAFTAAAIVLSLILVGGTAQGISGLFLVVAVDLAALMVSYLAICAERWSALVAAPAGGGEIRAAARAMAQAAAHNSMLVRLSGRPDANTGGGR